MRVNEWNMQKPLAALGVKDTGVGIRNLGFPPGPGTTWVYDTG